MPTIIITKEIKNMANYKTINGERFDIIRPRKNVVDFYACARYDRMSLDSYYNRPSDAKKSIWEYWRNWAYEAGTEYFGISAANCNFFSITGGYIDENGRKYVLQITPAHNRAIIAD